MNNLVFDQSTTYVIGDVHGKWQGIVNNCRRYNITNSLLIQCGDFGLGFHPLEEELRSIDYVNVQLAMYNNVLLAIRGNHDNPSFFNSTHQWFSNIWLLKDYTTIVNIKKDLYILCIGGGVSLDRHIRKQDVNWWQNERFVLNKQLLDEINIPIDTVITHICPQFAVPNVQVFECINTVKTPEAFEESVEETKQMTKVYEKLNTRNHIVNWFHGHFHMSKLQVINNTKFTSLSELEFKELR